MSGEVDYTHQWDTYPVELDGWVLAHRMLIADQKKIKNALTAFVEQIEKGHSNLTPQQWSAFKLFWNRFVTSLHHHHENEEKIAFPYLSDIKHAFDKQKVTSDHVTLLTALENVCAMVEGLDVNTTSSEEEVQALKTLLKSFILLDEALVEHFYEEEETFLPHLRKCCTVKEIKKHVTKPIVSGMGWEDRGQYFGKLTPDKRSAFMRQEGIPFFVKWIFNSNINRYNKTYVAPLDQAVVHAQECVVAAAAAPAISAGGH